MEKKKLRWINIQTNKSKKANSERKKAQFIQIVNKKRINQKCMRFWFGSFVIYLIEYESTSRFCLFLWLKLWIVCESLFIPFNHRYVPNPEWSCIWIKHPSQENVISSILNSIWKQPLLWKMDEWMREMKFFILLLSLSWGKHHVPTKWWFFYHKSLRSAFGISKVNTRPEF